MAFIILLFISYFAVTAIGVLALWRYRRASPIFWHQAALALMAFGTFVYIDEHFPSDRVYVSLMLLAHVVFLLAAFVTARANNLLYAYSDFSIRQSSSPSSEYILICLFFFIISSLVTVIYYYMIGYNVLILLFQGGVGIEDYSDLRLAAYSGDEYFAPGYVNQFKNALLPITAIILTMRLVERGRRSLAKVFALIVGPLLLAALAGTGQRAFIVYTIGAYAFGYFLHSTGLKSKVKIKYLVLGGIGFLAIFMSMTVVYQATSSPWDMVVTTLARFTSIQQEGGLFGFQYIYRLPITWFGEWWESLMGVLPGVEGSRIAHDIHAALYGSERGTVPLTTVGSAYYNGGVLGVVLLFGVSGLVFTLLYVRFLKGERNYARSYSYGFIFFHLSIFVAGSPTILLDNGVVTIMIFLWILRIVESGRTKGSLASAGGVQ